MNGKSIYAAIFTLAVACLMLSCGKPTAATEAVAPSTDHINMMLKDWERAKRFTQAYLDSSNDKSVAYKLSVKNTPHFWRTVASFGRSQLRAWESSYWKVHRNGIWKT